jgi:xanthine permease XanP
MLVPNAWSQLPGLLQNILSSAVSTAGFTAIIMTLILPDNQTIKQTANAANTAEELDAL